MDGIPVKLSNKYKTPRNITIPANIVNHLQILRNTPLEEYDFSFERAVVEQMTKLKEYRESLAIENAKRLAEEQAAQSAAVEENLQNLHVTEGPTQIEENGSSAGNTSPTRVTNQVVHVDNPILTPVPIAPNTSTSSDKKPHGVINLSEFEYDTSSPFDNMELKSINDLEELADVLGSKTPQVVDKPLEKPVENNNSVINGYTHQNVNWYGGYMYGSYGSGYPGGYVQSHYSNYGGRVPCIPVVPPRSIPPPPVTTSPPPAPTPQDPQLTSILASLQTNLSQRHSTNTSQQAAAAITADRPDIPQRPDPCALPNPIDQIPVQCQALARRLAEMGFSLARAARATQHFGSDEAKVVEFLLMIQKLEDKQKRTDDAERAIIASHFDEDAAQTYLDSFNQLLDLGFDPDQVTNALSKCNHDRDKALDFLVS